MTADYGNKNPSSTKKGGKFPEGWGTEAVILSF
jgi:hypothetical protein